MLPIISLWKMMFILMVCVEEIKATLMLSTKRAPESAK